MIDIGVELGEAVAEEPQGKSAIELLLDQLEAHERAEGELLGDYREAAANTPDAGVRFLMGLVLEDEERHRRLVSAMAKDVHGSLTWAADEEALPTIRPASEFQAPLLAQTLRFLEIEEDSARELKELQREVRQVNAGLLELLVAGMLADTNKHIDILKFVRRRLETDY